MNQAKKLLSRPTSTRSAFTVLEALLSMALLSLMLVAAFWCYRMGALAWKKSEAQSELQNTAQLLQSRLCREVERSIYASASADPPGTGTAFALLLPVTNGGDVALNSAEFVPSWQRYGVFYLASEGELRFRDIPLAPGSPEANNPEPIDRYDAGGMQPLSSYRTGGQVLGRGVRLFEVRLSQGLAEFTLRVERPRFTGGTPESYMLHVASAFRN
jgi:type II secretory pathway pseudopilin PulG